MEANRIRGADIVFAISLALAGAGFWALLGTQTIFTVGIQGGFAIYCFRARGSVLAFCRSSFPA